MTTSSPPALATTRTGGLGFTNLVLLVLAFGLIALQLFFLAFPGREAAAMSSRQVLGIAGPLALAGLVLLRSRKGEASLNRHELSGKTTTGTAFSLKLSTLAPPDLNQFRLSVRDAASGKLLLSEPNPDNPHFLGTWWLLSTYPNLPNAVWEAFAADTAAPREGAVRSFLDYEGRTTFLDAGCVIELFGEHCFFPTTATQPFIQSNPGGALLSTNMQSKPMQLRFEPNPARLPMERFLRALARKPLDAAHADLLDTLLDTHGGCRLARTEQGWSGECAGYPVEVVEAAQ